jgi:hypothetical protein
MKTVTRVSTCRDLGLLLLVYAGLYGVPAALLALPGVFGLHLVTWASVLQCGVPGGWPCCAGWQYWALLRSRRL